MRRRIVLFGGSFDPIHLGHTTVARDALEQLGGEGLVFIPAKRSPLKGFMPFAGDEDRRIMASLAVAGDDHMTVSDCELNRPGPSYTLDTVAHFRKQYGDPTDICWLIGADTVDDLAYWHRITDLIDACRLCTMYRAGCDAPSFSRYESSWGRERVARLRADVIETPLVNVSSTEIRRRLATGRDVADMLAPAVLDYIRAHGLYKSLEPPSFL
ncbi:MAG TPA: nicotinate (nicotinamide) nucleotide adenylyltransferase [Phycisphaerales bacterium]|nr:nicotinate (nicotinamide) nucleotide adenylyltransferase [Phycisphaerales bacterium]